MSGKRKGRLVEKVEGITRRMDGEKEKDKERSKSPSLSAVKTKRYASSEKRKLFREKVRRYDYLNQ